MPSVFVVRPAAVWPETGSPHTRIGTAGWTIPRTVADEFPANGTHLERYARVFSCAEINSTFYRAHRARSYLRWAASVPDTFRFAVKLRRTITHERRLVGCDDLTREFLEETAALGKTRGVILIQLPPSLAYDEAIATHFFAHLRRHYTGAVACEPRHASWFVPDVNAHLRACAVSRVAADPARAPQAAFPGGDLAMRYFRWHGAPRMYWSTYEAPQLQALAGTVAAGDGPVWCIFDNTAHGAATENALALGRFRTSLTC
jgi:uncharacterized protein YecE (DUF72 family)